MERLFHDFNKLFGSPDSQLRVAPLVCRGTEEDLSRLGIALTDGLRVTLYQPDIGPEGTDDCLEVEATVRYDQKMQCFCADFSFEELMYRSEREKKNA